MHSIPSFAIQQECLLNLGHNNDGNLINNPQLLNLRPMYNNEKNSCEVWSVGGGKGGVGKSFLISNIAHCLAIEGKKTILIDADYGGANLHSILGITKPARSLTDFFTRRIPLQDLVIDSGIPNLGLVVGMIRSFAPESINYAQKLKFHRHIRLLEADYVLVDLGSGANFNIIDTFCWLIKKSS